jgi:transposase-like protein
LNEEVGVRELCRQEKISAAQIYKWKTAYLERGIKGLENSRKPRSSKQRRFFQNREI